MHYTLIDLTHEINSDIPTWDGSCGFHQKCVGDYDNPGDTKFKMLEYEMRAGCGTHMDAPSHCNHGEWGISDIPVENCVGPLCVIDIQNRATPDYLLSIEDVKEFEKAHGPLEQSIVVIYTGWSRFWSDPNKYRNPDSTGKMHFPTVSKEAGCYLFDKGVKGLAIDTLSSDLGHDGYFPNHEQFLSDNRYLIENVANAHLLPPKGAMGYALPLKIFKGSESPIRFIAMI